MRTITLLIAWLSLSASALSQNLVAYYPFNGNANDQTANAINPSYVGSGVTLTTDRFGNSGKAYHFDGLAGSYMRMPADLLPVANRTISFWFNAASVSNRPMLVNYGGQGFLGYGTSFLTGLNVGGCGCYQTQAHYANNLVTYGYGADPINQWIHWVITISGSTTKMYLNGTMVSNAPASFINNTFVSGRDLSLGVMVGAGGIAPYTDPNGDYFQGKLDDIRIYDDALTDAQVIQLYNDESVGLVAFYPFNGNANDLSGNGNNGTVNGATLTTDRFGNANSSYSFNGTGDFISTSNLATTVTDNFSMTAWVKPASLSQLGSIIINGSDNGGGSLNGYAILLGNGSGGSGDKLTGLFPGVEWINPNLTLAASNIWVHVAMVRNGSITTLYLNGVAGAVTTTTAPAIPSGSLRIGSQMGIRYFNGAIDEVKVFNKALSAVQVQQLFNNESVGLVAYYPFNGNANDESGFGRHGTATNGAALTTDRFGNTNSAYNFDGINDYIDIPATGLPETNRTVMFWLNPATGNQPSYPLSYGGNGCGTSYLMGFNASGSSRYNTQGHCNSNGLSTAPWSVNPENQWTHFAVTISGTAIKIFINGVESNSNNGFSIPTYVDGRKLFIGALITPDGLGTYTDGSGGYFKGKLDDIKIYNTALSSTQVAAEYSALVAYYPFNGNANDESGNNINPVYNGAVLTADRFGNPNKAYYFDGTNSNYIKVPADLFPTTHRSVSFWFNADEVATGPVLFAYGGDGNCGTSTFIMGLNVNQFAGYVCVGHYGANQSVYPYSAPPVNNWKHWVVTVNGSTIKMYVNGVLVKTDNVYSGSTYVPSKFAIFGGDVYCDGVTPYAPFFKGKLDEVRVYNNVLSDAEVAVLFASESPLPDALVTPASQTTCSGSAITPILITGNVPSTVFNWTRDNISSVTGIAASGAGDISGTLTNTTNAPVLVTFTIMPTVGGNTGTPVIATVLVNPLPDVIQPGNQGVCNNSASTAVNFSGSVAGTDFNWTNNNTSIGLAASGTGSIPSFTAINATASPVTATVTVTPTSGGNYAYIPNYNSGTVSVINMATNTIWTTIPVGLNPNGITVNHDGSKAYIANFGSNSVSVINTATNQVTATIPVGSNPYCLAINKTGNLLYVANCYANTVSVINTVTNSVVSTIPVGSYPYGVAISPDGSRVYISNINSDDVSVINTGTNAVVATIPGIYGNPRGVAVSIDGSRLYVAGFNSNILYVINTATNSVLATTTVGSMPQGVCVSPDGNRVYVSNSTTNNLYVINTATNTVSATINAGSGPLGVSVNADGSRLYVANFVSNNVSVVNTVTNLVVATIPGFSAPAAVGNFISENPVCTGTPKTFTITVNPTPDVTQPANQAVCNNTATAAISFAGSGTNFNWTNNTTSIGLGAGGTGNIPSFTAINATASPVTATITVTPSTGSNFAYITNRSSNNVSVINTATHTVVATVNVGSMPIGVSVMPDGSKVYVTNYISNNVSVINTATNTVMATVPVGTNPYGLSVSPDGSRVYVANIGTNNVSVINTATNTVVNTISVGTAPAGVNLSPDGSRLYIVNNGSNNVSVINTSTSTVLATISVGSTPFGVTVSPDGSKVYVANQNSNNISVINAATNLVDATFTVGSAPVGTAISADGSRLYVTNQSTNNVSVINTATNSVVASVTVGTNPFGISISADGSRIYVANYNSNDVSVINPATNLVVATIAAGSNPNAFGNFISSNPVCTGTPKTFNVTVNPTPDITQPANQVVCNNAATAATNFTGSVAGSIFNWTNNNTTIGLAASGTGNISSFTAINATASPVTATVTVTPSSGQAFAYITNFGSNNVSVINTATNNLVTIVNVGTNPVGLSVSPDGSKVYIANYGSNNVSVINTGTNSVVATVGVGSSPYGVSVSPDGSKVYIANQVSGNVSVINAASNSVVATVAVGAGPFGICVSPDGSKVYVTNYNSNNVSVINTATNTVGATVTVGTSPTGISLNTDGSKLYVANYNSDNVMVINTATNSVIATVNTGAKPIGLSVGPDGSKAYTANNSSSNVSVINTSTNTVSATVAVGSNPIGLSVSTDGSKLYVANQNSNNVSVISTATNVILTTVPVGSLPYAFGNFISGSPVCTGTPKTFTISVNPTPNAVPTPSSQTICSGIAITPVLLTGNVSGTVYNWTRDNTVTVTGIAASGTGDISGILTNTGNAPVTVSFTITPSYTNAGATCTGTAIIATVTVKPIPNVLAAPANQLSCSGLGITPITLTGYVSGTVYNWTRDNTATVTGIAASGSGNISGILTNTTASPVMVTFTITPTANGCTGLPLTATVLVNPIPVPTISGPASVCVGSTNVVYTTESGMTGYTWSVSAGGTITAGAGTNAISVTWNTVGAQTVFVNYTNTNGCSAVTATSKAVAVTPAPGAVATPASQTTCSGLAINTIILSGNVAGATYNWTRNNTISVTGIPASGLGDISGTLTNTTGSPVTVTFTITATANGCTGAPVTATVLVNPSPDALATPASQTACSGAVITSIAITGTVSGTIFNWTRNYTGSVTGIAASGSGNISGALTNTTNAPVTVTFTITPTVGGCAPGTPVTATVLVNPAITMNVPGNQVVCNNTMTAAVNFSSSVTGGSLVYNWVNSNSSVGLPSSGSGNIPPFTAVNTGALPQVATITVTPVYTNGGISCSGTTVSFNITVNPPPTLGLPLPSNQVLCNGTQTTPVLFTTPAPGVYFTWTNNQPSIGLATIGAGNIPAFIATNFGTAPVTATITVTPQNGVCAGIPVTFTITVNPSPSVNAITNQVLCNGAATATVNITGPVTGTIYNWTNNNTSIGLAASGNGSIPSFTAINNTGTPVTAVIAVTATYTGSGITCSGIPVTFTITVNPVATVNGVGNQVLCSGDNTSAVNFSGTVSGSLYNWTNSNTNIGLAASGTGNIPVFMTANGTNIPISGTITVTPSANGCTGIPVTFTITVNPVPVVNQPASQTVCNGAAIAAVNFTTATTGGTVMYNWSNSNTSIGLAASGTGNIPAFTATNPGTIPVTAIITVTPVLTTGTNGCGGASKSFTITVNPGQNINLGAVPVRICLTDTMITLTGYPAGGSWSGRGVITGTNTFSPTLAGKGVTVLTYTVTSACGGSANVNVSVNDCIERHNIFAQAIRIFPNPGSGLFNIRYLTDVFREFNMDMTDIYGNTVKRMHFSGLVYGSVIQVDLRILASGPYVLKVYNELESAAFPIIIAH